MNRIPSLPTGTLKRHVIESKALVGNLLNDPSHRAVDVYIPHGHDGRGLPLLVSLAGFTSSGLAQTGWRNFSENVPERLDRLIATQQMEPAVIVFPDCFTRLGGNQYINSTAMGRWADFLIHDMLPVIEQNYRCGGAGKRGLFGKSSGGYGAIVHAMLYPDIWSACACHAGDMAFEVAYLPDMPRVLRALAREGGDIKRWIEALEATPSPAGEDIHVLMMLAMAASYDPDPSAYLGIHLPVDPQTCETIPERWEQWLAWDPLRLVQSHGGALQGLKALFVDCGDRDQYNFLYCARRMHRALRDAGVTHRYEEFSGTHSGIDHRLDVSLPFLVRALSA
jgi:enterochelin esterase-like enzyme